MSVSILTASFAIILAFHIPAFADEGKDESGKGRESKEYRVDKGSWKQDYKGGDEYRKEKDRKEYHGDKDSKNSITVTTLINTAGTASVPTYTTMGIAVSIFLQGIIRPLVNAAFGIQIGPQGISRHLSDAVIRCQEARGSSRTPAICRTMYELQPTTWPLLAEFWKSVNMTSAQVG